MALAPRLPRPRWFALCWRAAGFLVALPISAANSPGLTATPLAQPQGAATGTRFVVVPPEQSGVQAENRFADPRMWGPLYHEFEVGAIGTGVAIGDYDNDGRPDLFIVSKTESCRLFRNLGDWRFEDVTARAGVEDKGDAAMIWKQGAAFADVNNDGWLDLYVCRFDAPNLLYLNQRDGTFKEGARTAGLDVKDASSMAAFCDYDRDGWLDVFIQTNLLNNAQRPAGQHDYLFRNNRDGTFSDVTVSSGMRSGGETQGHSATWWDYNADGWPDLYVANDFAVPDRLYRNNGDGTFTDTINETAPRVTYSSMGSDLADVNNDGWMDFLATDMAASTHQKDQRTMAETRGRTRDPADGSTTIPNYLWNALLINTGTGRFLEAARLAGIAATDWTWGARFEDLDNDGRVDLHVTNGMHREIHNTDLILRLMTTEAATERIKVARNSPVLAEANLAFRNIGDLQFVPVGSDWGLDQKGVSFGAAFGDLDGDGDLDLVFSNYEAGPTVLRNDSVEGQRLVVALRGSVSNRFGVGAMVRIETARGVQIRQLVLARGYLSTSEPMLHFGLGEEREVKRLVVTWPSGHEQVFTNVAAGQRLLIAEPTEPAPGVSKPQRETSAGQFSEVGQARNLRWQAAEEPVDEIAQQRLLPSRLNRRGPPLAVGDIDGDDRDDLVFGGTSIEPARVLLRGSGERFALVGTIGGESRTGQVNHGPILLFDANGDGFNDVLLTRGGNSLPAGVAEYQPRLWYGSAAGLHEAEAGVLPSLHESVGAAVAADFDGDGRLDLFLGSRVTPAMYPLVPRSALLLNRGDRFEDVTDRLAPALREVGMVTSALASDVDADGRPDLLLALEWGPVTHFRNAGGGNLSPEQASGFSAAGAGWWTTLVSGDFNGDGRLDYLAGNVGLNTPYQASADRPTLLFAAEPEGGGAIQLVEALHDGETLYPRRSRKELAAVLPGLSRKFPRNDVFARTPFDDVVGKAFLESAQRLSATELRSGVFLSQPEGGHRFAPLPRLAQISPVQGAVAGDFNGDGAIDLYLAQNAYAPSPVIGRFDGGLSQLLAGDGRGGFLPVPHRTSQLVVPGDAKAMVALDWNDDGWADFLVSRNQSESLAFENRAVAGRHPLRIRLNGGPGNRAGLGAVVTVDYANGARVAGEWNAGSGWLSQSSASLFFGYTSENPPQAAEVRWPDGQRSRHTLDNPQPVMVLQQPAE